MKFIVKVIALLFLSISLCAYANGFADTGNSFVTRFTGVAEMWWYNRAEIFSDRCEVDYYSEDATALWVEGEGDGYFGVRFPCWEYRSDHIKPVDYGLEKNSRYEFRIACFPAPDLVLFDDKVVWQAGKGIYEDQYVKFDYIPAQDKEMPLISIVKKASPDTQRLYVTYTREPKLEYRKSAYSGVTPVYEKFTLSPRMKTYRIDPQVAPGYLPQYNAYPSSGYQALSLPLPQVDYPVDDMKIAMFVLGMESGISPYDAVLFPYVTANKINILGINNTVNIEEYARLMKAAGMDIFLYPVVAQPGKEGSYKPRHWISHLTDGKLDDARHDTIEAINRYLRIYPQGTIYLFCPEFHSIYGAWSGGVTEAPLVDAPGYKEAIKKGGVPAFKAIFAYWSELFRDIKAQTDPERVKVIMYFGSADQGAHAYKSGGDIFIDKNIHRQSVNRTVANARGAGRAYGKDYGFAQDCFDRQYLYGYHPDEVDQILKVYFHSGGRYMTDEITYVANGRQGLTATGKRYFDFIRYARLHPQRGEQQVRIGIMRGLPDEWAHVAGPTASWEATKNRGMASFQPYLTDYNLLNLVFADYGLFYRTYTDRLCTGTPYGPVDMIPWDTPLDKLKRYDIVVYLGKSTCMDDKQYGNLKEYVAGGGTLVMAAGQLRREDGTYYRADLSDLFGTRIKGKFTLKDDSVWDKEKKAKIFPPGRQEYVQLELTGQQAGCRYRLKNSDPYVVENRLGLGKAYLFATEYLTKFDEGTATRLIMPELEKAKWLDFNPGSSWLEYMVQRKGDSYVIPIFNHGNVGFPSGNGRRTGLWSGEVILDLNKFAFPKGRLYAYQVLYKPGDKSPFVLTPLSLKQDDKTLAIKVEVDKFVEIIIGCHAERDFYDKLSDAIKGL